MRSNGASRQRTSKTMSNIAAALYILPTWLSLKSDLCVQRAAKRWKSTNLPVCHTSNIIYYLYTTDVSDISSNSKLWSSFFTSENSIRTIRIINIRQGEGRSDEKECVVYNFDFWIQCGHFCHEASLCDATLVKWACRLCCRFLCNVWHAINDKHSTE